MTDNRLRERIARALYEDWWHVSESWHEPPRWEKLSDSARDGWLRQGDVVIRELGLEPHDDGHNLASRRYITRWIDE